MATTLLEKPAAPAARLLLALASLGVLTAFATVVIALNTIERLGKRAVLSGADNELGYPASILLLVVFVFALALSLAVLAGATPGRSLCLALLSLLLIGSAIAVWSCALAFTPLMLGQFILLLAATVVTAVRFVAPANTDHTTPLVLPLFLLVASVIGFFAAFRLVAEKITSAINPSTQLSCDFTVLVQCGKNLASWQGSLFGFPNPLIGVGGWVAVFAVAVMMLGGVSFARWFWVTLNAGMLFALVFIAWLIGQSLFALATLCPWCMVTWAVVIPSFWLITLSNAAHGHFGGSARFRSISASIFGYIPLITIVCYLVVALLAQSRLDVIHHIWPR